MPLNPFQIQRQTLGGRLFRGAGVFGQQGAAFLSSQGQFDPNLAQAFRSRAFGQATQGLSLGLAELARGEGQYLTQQRQLDLQSRGLDLQERELEAMIKAGEINIWDVIGALGSGSQGLAELLMAL